MDLRDLKLFVHLAESCHFGQTAHAMHVSPSTLSRQIQRLEAEWGHPLFLRDNRSATLTNAGKQFFQFARHTLLHYQQLRQSVHQDEKRLSGELHLFCSVTAAYSHLPPILDRFRADYPLVEIKLTTGDAANAIDKVQRGDADLAIAGYPDNSTASLSFTELDRMSLVLIAPAYSCPVQQQVTYSKPDWSRVPFILPAQGPARKHINRWLRHHHITNPVIYATVSGHEAIVSMVALGCGIALLPQVVLENSPQSIRNRIKTLNNFGKVPTFKLGVCVQKKRLGEPLIAAFWRLLPPEKRSG